MRRRISLETRITGLALVMALPPAVLCVLVMALADVPVALLLLTTLLLVLLLAWSAFAIHRFQTYDFRSLINLLEALRRQDFSLRLRSASGAGEFAGVATAANELAALLSEQRQGIAEGAELLQTVIDELDIAIIALRPDSEVFFMNPAARRLLSLLGGDDEEAALNQLRSPDVDVDAGYRQITLTIRGQPRRFSFRKAAFRHEGRESELLFITDVRSLLRSEERRVWQSVVRVLSHEINNSLAPITSIAGSLERMFAGRDAASIDPVPVQANLRVVRERAAGLAEFVDSYSRIAKLPPPERRPLSVEALVEKACALFDPTPLEVIPGPALTVNADPVQLEQVLINLLQNAVEATTLTEDRPRISVGWSFSDGVVRITIADNGPGIANPDNLFVPFYTTKKSGSGIGLLLCRQIVEAHGGSLFLNSPEDGGCDAVVELPEAGATTDATRT